MLELSILIPSYNRAPLLERCLRGVLKTTATSIEVLVSDNASTDNTPAVVKSFNDPRLRAWRNEANIGMERNILKVLTEARGKWVLYLTDDDQLLPGAIERLLELLRANDDVGLLLSDLRQSREDGGSVPDYRFCERSGRFEAGLDALEHLLWATHILSRMVMRREWIDLPGTERHLGSMYPQTYSAGSVLKQHPGYYLADCLVEHTVGNKTFWDYTPDYMVGTRIALIEDLLPGDEWREARRVLIGQVITEIHRHHFEHAANQSFNRWCQHQRALWRIRAVRRSPRYWSRLAQFVARRPRVWWRKRRQAFKK